MTSATLRVASATFIERGSRGSKSNKSERKTAVHEGSRPTISIPFSTYGVMMRSRFDNLFFAPSSCPVLIHVRPQHAASSGINTSYPMCSSKSLAACAPEGVNESVKESTQRRICGFVVFAGICLLDFEKDFSAKRGSWRFESIPPKAKAILLPTLDCVTVLTRDGESEASAAHRGNQPST